VPVELHRTPSRVRTRTALALFLCLLAMLAVVLAQARAQGTDFTGEIYYGGPGFAPLGYEYASEVHSYGFNSARNGSAFSKYIGAGIRNFDNGNIAAHGFGFDLVRVCVHGTYPNCRDTDGWAGGAWVENGSNYTITIEGHGVY